MGHAGRSGRMTALPVCEVDTALRLGRYFGNGATFGTDLQSQYDIGQVERERGDKIAQRLCPADAA